MPPAIIISVILGSYAARVSHHECILTIADGSMTDKTYVTLTREPDAFDNSAMQYRHITRWLVEPKVRGVT